MSPPRELEQIDALNSISLNPFVDSLFDAIFTSSNTDGLTDALRNFWLLLPDYAVLIMLKIFSFSLILSIILIAAIVWTSNRLMNIRQKMHDTLTPIASSDQDEEVPKEIVNEKWQKVVTHINSTNPSDWKLAILECDIILEDILDKMGYNQPTMSEKLKSIEPSDFTNIEAAWEAYKIRNAIAHEGSEFLINEREAKRVIGLYELVFREFNFI